MGDSNVHCPAPVKGSLKRSLQALDPEIEPASKRHRLQSPVYHWLTKVVPTHRQSVPPEFSSSKILSPAYDRASSAPAKFDNNELLPTIEDLVEEPKPLVPIDEMGDRRDADRRDADHGDGSISQSSTKTSLTKIKPSSSQYGDVLEYNDVYIDRTGFKMSDNVRAFVDDTILKKRTSPPLPPEMLTSFAMSMEKWGSSTESAVGNITTSPMFPANQANLGTGGNSRWSRDALPFDPSWGYPLSTPVPDYHVGYAPGRQSGFSKEQAQVLNHSYARSHTRPATGSIMPFLVAEFKSGATGGTVWHAENQAAGSGTYCVSALNWLLDQARISGTETDTAAFSLAASGRVVMLSIHWHSLEEQAYYMSYVKGFVPTDTKDIQQCHSVVKNIVEWALGTRHKRLEEVLQTLFPLPDHWTEKRTATAAGLDEEPEPEPPPLAASFASHASRDSQSSETGPSGHRRSLQPTRRATDLEDEEDDASLFTTHVSGSRRTSETRQSIVTKQSKASKDSKMPSLRR